MPDFVTPPIIRKKITEDASTFYPGNDNEAWLLDGVLVVGVSPTLGLTTAQVNTLIAAYAAPLLHAHDDRYYTESEIDTALALKANLASPTFTGAATLNDLAVNGTTSLRHTLFSNTSGGAVGYVQSLDTNFVGLVAASTGYPVITLGNGEGLRVGDGTYLVDFKPTATGLALWLGNPGVASPTATPATLAVGAISATSLLASGGITSNTGFIGPSSIYYGWSDAVMLRGATGPTVDLCAAGGGRSRNLADNADAPWTCSTLTSSTLTTGTIACSTLTFSGQLLPSSTAQDLGSTSALVRHINQRGDYFSYNAGFSGTTNYERARHYWSSNVYTIATDNGGTGSGRNITIAPASQFRITCTGVNTIVSTQAGTTFNKPIDFANDNTHDIGAASLRPRDVYIGRSIYVNTSIIMPNETTPASASATGVKGTIVWDANYLYVCVATNTWKRTALSTW